MRRYRVLFLWVIAGLAAVAVPAHFWITDRLGVLRTLYPLQAPLVRGHVRCSPGAPAWMAGLLDYAVDGQFSLANQIAYIAPNGTAHHCENGWKGTMLLSPALTAETRFRYASLSKLLTADAILNRVRSGELALDRPLLDVLPELRPVADVRMESVTVAHLLRHSAGFDLRFQPDPVAMPNSPPWCPRNLARFSRLRLLSAPGERYSYTNLAYCLLGVILERVDGRPFREIMEAEYGLAARGMTYLDGPYLPDEVSYDFRNSEVYGENYYRFLDFSALASAAGLSGNAVEMAALLYEIARRPAPNLLSAPVEESCNQTAYNKCFGYAVSFYRPLEVGLMLYGQSGLLFGAASQAIIDSRGGVTVWLGSGMSRTPAEKSREFIEELSEILSRHYAIQP